jgi:hypothetical protein
MIQTVIGYAVVALAAAWIAWSMFLRGRFKRRTAKAGGDCGNDCACGD